MLHEIYAVLLPVYTAAVSTWLPRVTLSVLSRRLTHTLPYSVVAHCTLQGVHRRVGTKVIHTAMPGETYGLVTIVIYSMHA